jgi:hypothetical protein
MSLSSAATAHDEILLSVRETRLIVERILLLTDLPRGSVTAVREAILACEGQRLGALAHLRDDFDSIRAMQPARVFFFEADGKAELDAKGEHAWAIMPSLVELVVEQCRRPVAGQAAGRGTASLAVHDVRMPAMLAALTPLALRHQVSLGITITDDGALIRASDRSTGTNAITMSSNDLDPFLSRMLREGFRTPRQLWSDLYHLSNQSLTPDSVVSRRHAGPIIVDENGRIIGRTDDDETDLSLLSQPAA